MDNHCSSLPEAVLPRPSHHGEGKASYVPPGGDKPQHVEASVAFGAESILSPVIFPYPIYHVVVSSACVANHATLSARNVFAHL